ncbi:M23 family metallopeptidase [Agromyces mediolanus]|uniref:M23 family metallopeptidase n=1 Tax=Agromyces mediolanus TaxID=41986 RepID=UPI003833A3EE
MALKYGIPPGNPTVVWDDIEGVPGTVTNDPYVSWQYHLDRTNGRGGVDMTARWVPVYAPIDCHVEHYSGGAGIAVRMWAADGSGWSDVFDHLSSIAVPDGAFVPYGGRVGTSGDTGDVPPHLHWHRLDPSGIRRIPWDYFTNGTTTPTPTPKKEEIDMLFLINANDAAANPANRYALVGPGFWFVTSTVAVANNLATRFGSTTGSSASVTWAEWDRAFKAAVSSGFVPASGQTSRTV